MAAEARACRAHAGPKGLDSHIGAGRGNVCGCCSDASGARFVPGGDGYSCGGGLRRVFGGDRIVRAAELPHALSSGAKKKMTAGIRESNISRDVQEQSVRGCIDEPVRWVSIIIPVPAGTAIPSRENS